MEITDTDRNAIRSVIKRQLEAFQKNDARGAFTFASSGIQRQFGTPENFMLMVKTSYPAVYRPRSVLFEDIITVQGTLTQPVLLLDSTGVPVRAFYLMEHDQGNWRINGCYLTSLEDKLI